MTLRDIWGFSNFFFFKARCSMNTPTLDLGNMGMAFSSSLRWRGGGERIARFELHEHNFGANQI